MSRSTISTFKLDEKGVMHIIPNDFRKGCRTVSDNPTVTREPTKEECLAIIEGNYRYSDGMNLSGIPLSLEIFARAYLALMDSREQSQRFLDFVAQQAEWSQATFGTDLERGPIGPLKHLAKEVQEALANINDEMEYVDCFFLTLDAARRKGMTAKRLLDLSFKKLEINKKRKWNKPTSDDPVEHDRTSEDSREQAIAEAVAAERERCARSAEVYGRDVLAARLFALRIAAKIRSGK